MTDVDLCNRWGRWDLDTGQTRGRRNDHLETLETYWQMRHLFRPMLADRDNKIKELQAAHLETNTHLVILVKKSHKFKMYFNLIYTRCLELMGGRATSSRL